jgi:hypothetical protein
MFIYKYKNAHKYGGISSYNFIYMQCQTLSATLLAALTNRSLVSLLGLGMVMITLFPSVVGLKLIPQSRIAFAISETNEGS